jgi:hypothetical protein
MRRQVMNNRTALIAVGLMLLISTAAAEGIGNQISVSVHKEAEGNYINGEVTVIQDVAVAANVEGNYNDVEQNVDLYANFNTLVGTEDQPTTLIQQAILTGNVSGNYNNLSQNLLVNACNNDLTSSNLSQKATQKADIIGNYNDVSQSTYVDAHDAVLTLSDLSQLSALTTFIYGNHNVVDECAEQLTEHDSLTGSKMWQLIEMPSLITGSGHNLTQNTKEYSKGNSFTAGAVKGQKILAAVNPFGVKNSAIHDITLKETDSSMTGGTFIQESKVISKL